MDEKSNILHAQLTEVITPAFLPPVCGSSLLDDKNLSPHESGGVLK